jgi:hypothetical protein
VAQVVLELLLVPVVLVLVVEAVVEAPLAVIVPQRLVPAVIIPVALVAAPLLALTDSLAEVAPAAPPMVLVVMVVAVEIGKTPLGQAAAAAALLVQ